MNGYEFFISFFCYVHSFKMSDVIFSKESEFPSYHNDDIKVHQGSYPL